MSISKRFFHFVVFVVVIGVAGFGAFMLIMQRKSQLKKAPEYASRARPVTVSESKEGDYADKRHYLAVAGPDEKSVISSRVTASIVEVSKEEGDSVNEGDVLIVLDSRETKQKLREVSARLEQAKAELGGKRAEIKSLESTWEYRQRESRRDRRLAEENAIAKSEAEATATKASEIRGSLRSARKNYKGMKDRIKALRQQKQQICTRLSYYKITSPYRGVVADRFVDPGAIAMPGKALMEVEDQRALKLVFDVPQSDLPQVKTGQSVDFSVKGQPRRCEISLMYPSLNKARMMRAEAKLVGKDIEGVTSGAYVPVSVTVDIRKSVTLVPRSSLIESPKGETFVFVVSNEDRLKPYRVELMGYSGNNAAISGLQPGRQVVENTFLGWSRLSSGEKVEAIE